MEHCNVCTSLNEAQLQGIFEAAEEKVEAIFMRKISLCQLKPTGVVKAMVKIIEENDRYCSEEFDRPFFQQALQSILKSIRLHCQKMEEFLATFNELAAGLRGYEEEGFSFIDANEIKKTIKEIEAWPSTCYLGFFIIDIQRIRRSMLVEMKKLLASLEDGLPEKLEENFEFVENIMRKVESSIKSTTEETIETILNASAEVRSFMDEKEMLVSQKMAETDKILKIILELNPKKYEGYYLKRYRFKENLGFFQSKLKKYVSNLSRRISYLANEKMELEKSIFSEIDSLVGLIKKFRDDEETEIGVLTVELNELKDKYLGLLQKKKKLNDFEYLKIDYSFSQVQVT